MAYEVVFNSQFFEKPEDSLGLGVLHEGMASACVGAVGGGTLVYRLGPMD